jgi:hypothetical protein
LRLMFGRRLRRRWCYRFYRVHFRLWYRCRWRRGIIDRRRRSLRRFCVPPASAAPLRDLLAIIRMRFWQRLTLRQRRCGLV